MYILVNGEGDLVKSGMEKAEIHNAFFFASICTGRVCPKVSQVSEPLIGVHGHEAVPAAEEDDVRGHLAHLDIQDTMDQSRWVQGW